MGRSISDGFEFDAGGSARWRARNIFDFRFARPLVDWPRGVCNDAASHGAWLVLLSQPRDATLRNLTRSHAARAPPRTATNGTAGRRARHRRGDYADRIC